MLNPLLKKPQMSSGVALFNLRTDIGERNNVAAEHPDIVG